jgi:hypothetical protein
MLITGDELPVLVVIIAPSEIVSPAETGAARNTVRRMHDSARGINVCFMIICTCDLPSDPTQFIFECKLMTNKRQAEHETAGIVRYRILYLPLPITLIFDYLFPILNIPPNISCESILTLVGL